MKSIGLDLGDVWIGVAISDGLNITCRPIDTLKITDQEKWDESLVSYLKKLFSDEIVGTVVIGYPKTMSGNESEQTKKIVAQKEYLEKIFSDKNFVLWDERLSSKRADNLGGDKSQKITGHARAAAFILQSYLDRKQFS